MNRFAKNSIQKWKIIMYASILMVFLMGLILCGNNIYVYDYLDSVIKSWNVQQIVFGTIYFIYIFLHFLILFGAKKSKSKVFLVAVAAGVVCHYVIKWLDSDK